MSLLFRITQYCRRTGMPPTRFGRLAVNDPRLVGDLKRGREVGPDLEGRVVAFIARGPA
jgi:hypothetical protein